MRLGNTAHADSVRMVTVARVRHSPGRRPWLDRPDFSHGRTTRSLHTDTLTRSPRQISNLLQEHGLG